MEKKTEVVWEKGYEAQKARQKYFYEYNCKCVDRIPEISLLVCFVGMVTHAIAEI